MSRSFWPLWVFILMVSFESMALGANHSLCVKAIKAISSVPKDTVPKSITNGTNNSDNSNSAKSDELSETFSAQSGTDQFAPTQAAAEAIPWKALFNRLRLKGQEIKGAAMKGVEIHHFNPIYGMEMVVNQWRLANYLSELVLTPYRILAQIDPAIEVVGRFFGRAEKKLASKIAAQLQDFDEMMLNFGFQRPQKTRVIIGRKSFLRNSIGPVNLPLPIFNIYERKMADQQIALNPIEWFSESIENESVWYHERMHSLLHATYPSSSYILANLEMQEAIADFGAAHFSGVPQLGVGIVKEGLPLRDISKRMALVDEVLVQYKNPREVSNGTKHQRSLFLSSVFWELRQRLGVNQFNRLFKPLLDGLNIYRKSYEDFLRGTGWGPPSASKILMQNRQYILVTAMRVASELSPQLKYNMAETIHFMSKRNPEDWDPQFIFEAAQALSEDSQAVNQKGEDEYLVYQTISASLYGLSGFVVKWSSALWLGKKVFDSLPLY